MNIYKNSFPKTNNNQNFCYVINNQEIKEKVDRIINGLGPLSNKKIYIRTTSNEYNTYIKKVNENQLITINQEIINIEDILEIKRIS